MARIAVALLATAALCLGPAVAASADDAASPVDTSVPPESTVQVPDAGEAAATVIAEEEVEPEDTAEVEPVAEELSDEVETESPEVIPAEVIPAEEVPAEEVPSVESAGESDDGGEASTEVAEVAGSDTVAPTNGVSASRSAAGMSFEGTTYGERPKTDNCQETDKSKGGHGCNEPPECSDDAVQGSTYGDRGGDDDCQEPPECESGVAAFGGSGGDDDCQEPPECLVSPGHQGRLLSHSDSSKRNKDGKKGECPENPVIKVIPGACIDVVGAGGPEAMRTESVAQVIGSNLNPDGSYVVVVSFDGVAVYSATLIAENDGTVKAELSLSIVGDYVATITSNGHKPATASAVFTVRACPPVVVPELTVTVLPCPANDSALPLQAKLQATGLEPGVSYAVSVTSPSGFVWDGSFVGGADGTAEETVDLGANGDYTAHLEGAVAAIAFTAVKTCAPGVHTPPEPPAPPTPPTTPTPAASPAPAAAGPALPNTGSADTQPLLWAGLLTMLIAIGLMLQPVRARRTRR